MAPPSSPDKFPPEAAFTSPLITIEVGPDDNQVTFHIRKGVLTFYSGYFAAALRGPFVEAEENVCQLPEESPLIFEMFRSWIHTRTLYESTLEPAILLSYEASGQSSPIKVVKRLTGRQLIAHLFIFADAHDIPTLQNKALDTFARKPSSTAEPLTEAVGRYVLEHTVESSPLRKLVREMARRVLRDLAVFMMDESFESVVRVLPSTVQESKFYRWEDFEVSRDFLCSLHVHEGGLSCGQL